MKVRTIASVLVVAVAAASVPIYASAQGKPPAGAKKPAKKKGDKGAPSATSAEAPPPPPPEPPPPPPEPATPASTASAAPPAPTASASATQEAAAAPPPKNDDWKRTAGIISIGSGVVLLGGAFLFYKLNTNQNNSDGYHAYARNVPPDQDVCDAAKEDKKSPYLGADSPAQIRKICSRGKTYVTLEFVSLGLGAAAIGLGAYWLITSGKKEKAPASAWMLSPRLDAPGVDFAGRFLARARHRAPVIAERYAPTVMGLTLYHYWRSSSSWRVRWALAYKGLPYTSVPVNLLAGEQAGDAYKGTSPMGYVPALVVDGKALTESVAICEYLDDTHPERPLRPADPWLRGRMRQLVEIVNAGTQPIQNLAVLRRVSTDKETQAAWAQHFIDKGLTAFERLLAEIRTTEGITGDFALGDLSLADLFLVPQLYNARRFGVPLDAFPLSLAVEAAARDTEACAAACPDRWEPKDDASLSGKR